MSETMLPVDFDDVMLPAFADDLSNAPILKALSKDLKQAARMMTPAQARFLVDFYYTSQEHRIATTGQVRSSEDEEPNAVLNVLVDATATVEKRIKAALDIYTDAQATGQWLKAQYGIGPVLAAGLLAHINIERAPTVGHIWRFAGLDPTCKWEKGQKRPFNAKLKVLCWKCGQSFMKFSGRDECFYGKVYKARKALEIERNEAGLFADQAAQILATRKIGKETPTYGHYAEGHLPPGQIDARARRYAVKLFLSHLHEVLYWNRFEQMPPNPYVIDHLQHVDYIGVPHLDKVPGLEAARQRGK